MEELIQEVARLREQIAIWDSSRNIREAKDRDLQRQKQLVAELTLQLKEARDELASERAHVRKLQKLRVSLARELERVTAEWSASKAEVERVSAEVCVAERRAHEAGAEVARMTRMVDSACEESRELAHSLQELLASTTRDGGAIAAAASAHHSKAIMLESEVEAATGSVCRAHEAIRRGDTDAAAEMLLRLRRSALSLMARTRTETKIAAAVLAIFPTLSYLLLAESSPVRRAECEALELLAKASERPSVNEWKKGLHVLGKITKAVIQARAAVSDIIPDACVS